MPADAIHLAALADASKSAPVTAPMRLGALFIDLPYYERFWVTLAAHLAGTSLSWSRWGQRFHEQAPVALAVALLEQALSLKGHRHTRKDGVWLEAFALGYVCHAAIDRKLHPLVNRLAAKRPGSRVRAHQEVEKLQSILFHRERFGRELLGRRELFDYLAVDASPLWRSWVRFGALRRSTSQVLGRAVSRRQLERWNDGYRTYAKLMCSAVGKRAATEEQLEHARPTVYTGAAFPKRYEDAVVYARHCMDAAAEVADSGNARALQRVLPEGTLDGLDDAPHEAPRRAAAAAVAPKQPAG
jgi:hypothetical protein